MKWNNSSRISLKRIRSLRDLELEKAKLQVEIMKSEEKIRSNYRHLIRRLTIRNLLGAVTDEMTTGTSVLSKAISFGRSFFEKRKKKKKKKDNGDTVADEFATKHEETGESQTDSNIP